MTKRNHFNVIVLTHIEGDITITDMRVIAAWATETTETAMEVVNNISDEMHAKLNMLANGRRYQVYVQPYEKV